MKNLLKENFKGFLLNVFAKKKLFGNKFNCALNHKCSLCKDAAAAK